MYREAAAPDALADAVRCLWWSRTDGPARIVPDGCADLVVAGDRVFVAGPDTGPWDTDLAPGTLVHGIRFRPGETPRALGVPAAELTDRRVDLPDLWGRQGRAVAERLRDRPAALADVVAARLTPEGDPLLRAVLARLDAGALRVSAVLAELGLPERTLRRRFTLAVGYGPATYLRVARLRRAVAAAAHVRDLATLAAVAGYADQPHLARDCRDLAGSTPRRFFARLGEQTGDR